METRRENTLQVARSLLGVWAALVGVLLICLAALDWLGYGRFLWALWVQ